MLPRVGPVLFQHTGLSARSIAGGGSSGALQFRWPRDLFVTGLLLEVQTADPADLAALELRLQDQLQRDMFRDPRGTSVTVNALDLHGANELGPVWFALQRPVRVQDVWTATVTNTSAGTLVATLSYAFEEP